MENKFKKWCEENNIIFARKFIELLVSRLDLSTANPNDIVVELENFCTENCLYASDIEEFASDNSNDFDFDEAINIEILEDVAGSFTWDLMFLLESGRVLAGYLNLDY